MQLSQEKFVDVVFPRNVNRLTYLLPDEFSDSCSPGTIVEAPLRGRNTYGITVELHLKPPIIQGRRKFSHIHKAVSFLRFNKTLVTLLNWVSRYYVCTEGLALKNLLFADALTLTPSKRRLDKTSISQPSEPLLDTSTLHQGIEKSIQRRIFQTFLLHSKSIISEISLIMNIVRFHQNVIILVPEKYDLEYFLPSLETTVPGRYCVLHGDLGKSGKADSYQGLSSGKYDIVVGTMQAVFSPISQPSIIIVTREHSEFYKHEETPMYNVRDIAVKRGSIENAPVLLTSLAPSFESYYNATKGKYSLIEDTSPADRPTVKIINAGGSDSILSSPLKKSIQKTVNEKKNILLILNRKGYSVLQCNACGYIDICSKCNVPFVLHTEKILRCHYCNSNKKPYDFCPHCNSSDIKFISSGTEKAFKLLKKEFSVDIAIIDRDHIIPHHKNSANGDVIIGTEYALRKIKPFSQFGLTGVLNSDLPLHKPDFRVYEKLFQHFMYLSQLNGKSSEMFIQTYDWKNPFFSFVKRFDYRGFFKLEIQRRNAFNYPPFYKMMLLSIKKSALKTDEPMIAKKNYELLGPIYKGSGSKETAEFLIKYRPNIAIQEYVQELTETLAKDKKSLKINIDPLVFT